MVISTINHDEIGVICTNLAIINQLYIPLTYIKISFLLVKSPFSQWFFVNGAPRKFHQGVLTATVNTFLELARKNARSGNQGDAGELCLDF